MADRALLYSLRNGNKIYYAAAPFIHGLFEHHVHIIGKEFSELAIQMVHEEMQVIISENAKYFLRVVPVDRAVSAAS